MDVMQFTQALSRIWVLETRLLDKTKVERMLEANSADEVLKILGETEFVPNRSLLFIDPRIRRISKHFVA